MRLTKRNPETGQYEYIEPARTQAEFTAQRKAVIQRLGEYEDKASDVAEEIFAELKKVMMDEYRYPIIAELKKKYTEGEG